MRRQQSIMQAGRPHPRSHPPCSCSPHTARPAAVASLTRGDDHTPPPAPRRLPQQQAGSHSETVAAWGRRGEQQAKQAALLQKGPHPRPAAALGRSSRAPPTPHARALRLRAPPCRLRLRRLKAPPPCWRGLLELSGPGSGPTYRGLVGGGPSCQQRSDAGSAAAARCQMQQSAPRPSSTWRRPRATPRWPGRFHMLQRRAAGKPAVGSPARFVLVPPVRSLAEGAIRQRCGNAAAANVDGCRHEQGGRCSAQRRHGAPRIAHSGSRSRRLHAGLGKQHSQNHGIAGAAARRDGLSYQAGGPCVADGRPPEPLSRRVRPRRQQCAEGRQVPAPRCCQQQHTQPISFAHVCPVCKRRVHIGQVPSPRRRKQPLQRRGHGSRL